MRSGLKNNIGERKKFRAVFVRIGKKAGFKGFSEETILLRNITDPDTGAVLTDHVWLNLTESFLSAGIKEGTLIEFEARVKAYAKGYVNSRYKIDFRKTDFKLSHPTKFRIATS